MAKAKLGGLGKGLDALFVDNDTKDSGNMMLRLSSIEPNKDQPRKQFDEDALMELADSIRQHGVIQPLLVRPLDNGMYQLVAGERRWRASRMAGLMEVPVVIRDLSDHEAMEIALIENLQRKDLNVIEEALGYQQLMEKYDMTQEKVAERVGKSRPAVANALRLLNLPEQVIDMVKAGEVTAGHARALLKLDDEVEIIDIAKKIQKGRYSVRDVEKITAKKKEEPKEVKEKAEPVWQNSFYKEMELALATELGRKVKVTVSEKGNGSIELAFLSKEDLADIAARLTGNKW
ncbi:MAG: ParB/RepB/Spo0J family partition protein [Oscillospiraceae bacterium]|nr:ParB/RepB/Spo0J family partition protein [Oscillospiraceae bacterium]